MYNYVDRSAPNYGNDRQVKIRDAVKYYGTTIIQHYNIIIKIIPNIPQHQSFSGPNLSRQIIKTKITFQIYLDVYHYNLIVLHS